MQNLSARYNILYNGNLILDQAVTDRESNYHDHYQEWLPVFREPGTKSIQASKHLMDSVIGKANRIIHEKTKSNYIDQAYFLTGRANYEQGNYYNAAEFFTYVTRVYRNKPMIRQAALGWKARSLIQIGNLTEAALALDTAFMGLEAEKKSKSLIFATRADYYLRTGNIARCIDMLLQAIEHSHHQTDKMRWHYLLGQLLVSEGKPGEAYEHFRRVARSHVSDEMAFQAHLNSRFLIDSLNPSIENIDSLTAFEQALQRIPEQYPCDSLIVPIVKQHLAYIEAHRDSLQLRQPVLCDTDTARKQFVDEPSMTKWPELAINRGHEPSRPRQLLTSSTAQSALKQRNIAIGEGSLGRQRLKMGSIPQNRHENSYRNKELLPDSAVYYFAIHVEKPKVNLAPSRYAIRRFNRSQFAGKKLAHQLYLINKESQLLYIGIFGSYQEVELYESRIKPLLQTIMKIPSDIYQTFIITKDNLKTFTDEDKIVNYQQSVNEQK